LVDADEFDTYLEKRMFYESHRNHAYLKGIRDCRKDLAAMRTIEAEPVKHGRWIWKDHYLVCSECGEENDRKNYCPNCGARMGGGENG